VDNSKNALLPEPTAKLLYTTAFRQIAGGGAQGFQGDRCREPRSHNWDHWMHSTECQVMGYDLFYRAMHPYGMRGFATGSGALRVQRRISFGGVVKRGSARWVDWDAFPRFSPDSRACRRSLTIATCRMLGTGSAGVSPALEAVQRLHVCRALRSHRCAFLNRNTSLRKMRVASLIIRLRLHHRAGLGPGAWVLRFAREAGDSWLFAADPAICQ